MDDLQKEPSGFTVLRRDVASSARIGRLVTEHGVVETPAYIIVATEGEVRCLTYDDIPRTKTQIVIANTYHLWRMLGEGGLGVFTNLHDMLGWGGTVMTDSGGFQVFSFGARREFGTGKVRKATSFRSSDTNNTTRGVRVTEAGVYFMDGGEECYLDAETSIRIQEQLGADIVYAFDEPTSPLHNYDYTKASMERTHRWAERSLEAKASEQLLFGIVQGGPFEDLRKESARFVGSKPFAGFGIGGSYGGAYGGTLENTFKEVAWVVSELPEERPRHLMGIGRIEDVFCGVELGVDLFDCVIPTREARHGRMYTHDGAYFDIKSGSRAKEERAIDGACACPVCDEWAVKRSDMYKLFKEKDEEACRLATIHNVFFFNDLMERIRGAIAGGWFEELREEYARS